MKSMTKLMVVAMVLVAALVVAPAAARDQLVPNTNGTTIYVGEENLNFSSFGANFTQLVHYSDPAAGASDNIIRATTNGNITELTPAAVGTRTGTYYVFNGSGDIADRRTALGFVNVQNPEVTLRVLQGATGTTSADGQSVTKGSDIRFRIDHNLGDYPNALIDIRVTTPGGGMVTVLGNNTVELENVNLTDNQVNTTTPINMTGNNVALGAYTAQAVWSDGDFEGKGYNSNTVTFDVITGALATTADKDTVVRGNSFSVTITGESSKRYELAITNAGDDHPLIRLNQVGVTDVDNVNATANVSTTASGTRTVQFDTNSNTREATYTIRVTDPSSTDGSTYDEIRVKVEAGSMTVTASGTGTYYVGEEIVLSGTNTDSNDVYLFVTGPNLGNEGVGLTGNMSRVVDNVAAGNFTHVNVEGDDTWSYRWNTANINRALTSGGYTVYAVSAPRDRENLANTEYATATVQLRPGFITATMSSATIAKGGDVTVTGTAQGNPSNVQVWVFGKNYYGNTDGTLDARTVNVESDGSFEYDIPNTDNLAAGQYFVVVQHPMGPRFEVDHRGNDLYRVGADGVTLSEFVATLTNLQAAEAANALIDALESPYVNDAYTKLTFFLEDAWIRIDPIGDQSAGSTFTISGTTNLAAGEELIIEVTSAAFQPGAAGETTGFSSDAGTVTVQQGEAANTWSFEVDGTSFRPDQYIVTVESIEAQSSTSGTFNVVEGPAPTPTTTVTTTPTGTETTTPTGTTTTQATPTQSPGFGALVALAGLGAVAFLVLRRD